MYQFCGQKGGSIFIKIGFFLGNIMHKFLLFRNLFACSRKTNQHVVKCLAFHKKMMVVLLISCFDLSRGDSLKFSDSVLGWLWKDIAIMFMSITFFSQMITLGKRIYNRLSLNRTIALIKYNFLAFIFVYVNIELK